MNPAHPIPFSDPNVRTVAPPSITFDELRRTLLRVIDVWEAAAHAEQSKSIFTGLWDWLSPHANAATPPPSPTTPQPSPSPATPQPSSTEPTIVIDPGVVLAQQGIDVLRDVLRDAGLASAKITSGERTAAQQARIMYEYLTTLGEAKQRDLYGPSGERVIDAWKEAKDAGQSPAQIQAAMLAKINEVGPSKVSNHINPRVTTFDVAPSSIANGPAFVAALERARSAGTVSHYISEGHPMAYHIEVKRPGA
jgi:hypothetical protein